MSAFAIEVKNLTKRYKKAEQNSVDGISFTVKPGEFVAFLGPNGAGKTTTISILTTTLEKTGGEVYVNGKNLAEDEASIRRDIGIIFQKPTLDEQLSAEENIRVHAGLYGVAPFRPRFELMDSTYQQEVRRLLALVGLEAELHKQVKTFSGGMKRKLEIVRSLIHRPKILFLDEPTTGLDPVSRRGIWQYLDRIRKEQGITVFLTTHYLDEAEGCDKVIIVKDGRILLEGTPASLKQELKESALLLQTDEQAKLITELGRKNVHFTHEDNNEIRIEVKDPTQAQEIMRTLQTPLTSFRLFSPTLEEAYVKLIEN